jgi:hypothetical protein
MGGGFIQFIFGGVGTQPAAAPVVPQATSGYFGRDPSYGYATPDSIVQRPHCRSGPQRDARTARSMRENPNAIREIHL